MNLFNFHSFHVTAVETGSSINVCEVVVNMPRVGIKRNQGYGDNIGDGQIVPSYGQVYDPDLIDAPMAYTAPPFRPAGEALL